MWEAVKDGSIGNSERDMKIGEARGFMKVVSLASALENELKQETKDE